MLKSVERCLECKTDRSFGNHGTWWSMPCTGDIIQYFTYHGNVICRVNWTQKTVYLTNSGWDTRSTNRALNDYKHWFTENTDFEIIDKREN